MEIQAIFIYCLAEDIVRSLDLKDDPQTKMTSAEVITFVVISALYYQCDYKIARLVCQHCRLFSSLISHSRIVRRIHKIPESIWIMIFSICREFVIKPSAHEYVVDSFPVAVCQNYKRMRCKLFQGKKFHGYTASKKQYFFGIKVHMVVNAQGIPIEFVFTPGSEADIKGFRRLKLDLPKESVLFGDRAYNDYVLEDFLDEELKIKLLVKRKQNSKRQHGPYEELKLSLTRNRIETVFSAIVSLMPRCIRARTEKGFCLKVMFFILAYTIKIKMPVA